MRYHCFFLQDIIYNFRNFILLSQGYKVSPLVLLKNGCKSQKPFWTQIQQQSGIDATVPITSTANTGLHFGPICRAYVIDTVCFAAGWIDEKYDIMVLFLELLFHLSHGLMYCAFENGVRMFIQKDFNVKNDMRDCQHIKTYWQITGFICATMISIQRGFQGIATIYTCSSLHEHICMPLSTHQHPQLRLTSLPLHVVKHKTQHCNVHVMQACKTKVCIWMLNNNKSLSGLI